MCGRNPCDLCFQMPFVVDATTVISVITIHYCMPHRNSNYMTEPVLYYRHAWASVMFAIFRRFAIKIGGNHIHDGLTHYRWSDRISNGYVSVCVCAWQIPGVCLCHCDNVFHFLVPNLRWTMWQLPKLCSMPPYVPSTDGNKWKLLLLAGRQ